MHRCKSVETPSTNTVLHCTLDELVGEVMALESKVKKNSRTLKSFLPKIRLKKVER